MVIQRLVQQRSVGLAAQLEQPEVLGGGGIDGLIDLAALQILGVTAPAIEDVVVVPHHGARHPGQHEGDLGAAPLLAIELAIEAVELLHHGPGRLAFDLLLPVQLVPGLEGRHARPEGVRIDLISPHQQQGEGMGLVLRSQLVPHGVGGRGGGEQLEVGEAVAGGIAYPHLLLLARQMELPLVVSGLIVRRLVVQQDLVVDGGAGLALGAGLPDQPPEAPFRGVRLFAGGQQLAVDPHAGTLAAGLRHKADAVGGL